MNHKIITSFIGMSIVTSLLITGCSNTTASISSTESSSDNSVIETSISENATNITQLENYVYAEDSDNDGKYDKFDSDGDGVTDVNFSYNSDSNIDTDCGTISDFSFTSINGITYSNDTLKENKLNIVVIWGYWCPDCLYELYHLSNYKSEDSDDYYNYFDSLPDNVGIFGVSVGSSTINGSDISRFEEVVREYCDIYNITFDNILAADDEYTLLDSIRTYKTGNRDYSTTVPAVALIDSDGNILEVIYEGNADQVIEEINKHL